MMMDDVLFGLLTAPPELAEIKRALFIQPHPDDNEIGAGGLMAKLIAMGAEVWALTVTDDRLVCPPEQWENGLSLRQREVLDAQDVLGVKHAGFLGFADKTPASAEELALAIVPVIRKLRPDAVFSVDPELPNECHRDHIKVGYAARFAVMDAVWAHFPPGALHQDVWQTAILGQYMTAAPNTIADITDVFEKKMAAISKHASQVSTELFTVLELQAAYFGQRANVKYGEAVKLLRFLQLHCFNLPVEGII
ncbi:MAG: PIG-L family deacetylase [Oscillospiraceae bacterium]|jgi:LmbE family N-acetylglucosaminyl deacetylase|nr:PIG-L family deacetylase [Oscillospiraceae bacterium]